MRIISEKGFWKMTPAQQIKKLKDEIKVLNKLLDDQARVNNLLVAALIKMAEIKKRKKIKLKA